MLPDTSAPLQTTRLLSVAAASWGGNAWGGTVLTRAVEGDTVKMTLAARPGGDGQFTVGGPFIIGRRYRATLRARTDVPMLLTAFVRREGGYNEPQGACVKPVGLVPTTLSFEWQHRTTDPATLRVGLGELGTVSVSDVVVDEITGGPVAAVRRGAVRDELFGLHALQLGQHQNVPPFFHGALRLWNSATMWLNLEATQGVWNWVRSDMFVRYAQRSNLRVIFTLGFPPSWASSNPTGPGQYGAGSAHPPRSEAEYRNYIRTVATRYKGQVRHWEMWNEMNQAEHWQASPAELVRWTRITREELKAVDPANQLIGPTISGSGLLWLATFYAAGGADAVDIVGTHGYWGGSDPEGLISWYGCLRQIMESNGISDLPVWDTEGAPSNEPIAGFNVQQQRAVVARGMLCKIIAGVEGFCYFTLEGSGIGWGLVGSDFLSRTPAGDAFATVAMWTRGWHVADTVQADGVYVLKLRRGERRRYIVWRPAGSDLLSIPTSWRVTTQQPLFSHIVPVSAAVSVGAEPVMLE